MELNPEKILLEICPILSCIRFLSSFINKLDLLTSRMVGLFLIFLKENCLCSLKGDKDEKFFIKVGLFLLFLISYEVLFLRSLYGDNSPLSSILSISKAFILF